MKNLPEKIYLDLGESIENIEDFNKFREVTWSADNATGNGVEYVRSAEPIANRSTTIGALENMLILLRNNEVSTAIGGIEGIIEHLNADVRNAEKPSEDLVEQIFKIIDCNSAWNGKLSLQIVTESSIRSAATEIANLVTQREAELLDSLKKLISDINPENACRGKFAHLGGSKNSAYVGSKCMPSDESILNAIEIISKYEKP